MNSIYSQRVWTPDAASLTRQTSSSLDLDQIIAGARRQMWLASACVIAALVLAVLYLATTEPRYTARAQVLLDGSSSKLLADISSRQEQLESDASVLSAIELLTSRVLAEQVVDRLDLAANPDFAAAAPSLYRSFRGWLGTTLEGIGILERKPVEPAGEEDGRNGLIETLQRGISAQRVGRSFAVEIQYTHVIPALAASIAQAYADTYLADQITSTNDASRRAGLWLEQRVDELREQSLTASLAVEDFRSRSKLVTANGRLVSDQQLTELNSQLVLARTEASNARAKAEEFDRVMGTSDPDAIINSTVVADLPNDSELSVLQSDYIAANQREREIVGQYGPEHPQALAVLARRDQLGAQLMTELRRVGGGYANDAKVAAGRAEALSRTVNEMADLAARESSALVTLNELEQKAQSYRTIYESYLQKYQELLQQQSFPINTARIISDAGVPKSASSPDKKMALALALVLGLGAGVGFGSLREFRERAVRTGDQVRALGVEFLGYLPRIRRAGTAPSQNGAGASGDGAAILPPIAASALGRPGSIFAETLRSMQYAAETTRSGADGGKVFGIASASSGEGRTFVAANFAAALAEHGYRTLLIDCAPRKSGIARLLKLGGDGGQAGLFDVLSGREPLDVAVRPTSQSDLAVLASPASPVSNRSAAMLSSFEMRDLLAACRQRFDYVVLDLPSMSLTIDTKVLAPMVDGFFLVAEWGKTEPAIIESAFAANGGVLEKTVGGVLNKVSVRKLRLYDALRSADRRRV